MIAVGYRFLLWRCRLITLTPGRVLSPGDLYLLTRDASGNPFTPFTLGYTIFQLLDGTKSLVSSPGAAPLSDPSNPGYYSVAMTVPSTWAGTYQLVWTLQQLDGGPQSTVTEDFFVQAVKPGYNLEAPSVLLAPAMLTKPQYADIIMQVRELLSDTNPDRNYHFRPPTAAKTIANYSTRVGFIWEDSTILRMLRIALQMVNSTNPKNFYSFSLDNLQTGAADAFAECACLGAAYLCLTAEGARWTADEFGYSLNGVSLDLQKGQNYLSLATQYKTAFDAWLPALTANRPRSLGVRQFKWLR